MDTFKITGKDSLNILLRKRVGTFRRISIEIENIDEPTKQKFENDLNKFHASCGCSTGNYFLITTIILITIYLLFTGQTIINLKTIIQCFCALIFTAIFGKFTGKLLDRYKFKKAIQKLSYGYL